MAAPFHVPLILIVLYSVLVVALMVLVIVIRQPELMLLIMLPSVAVLFYLISHYLHEKSLANREKSNNETPH